MSENTVGSNVTSSAARGSYASVNGLNMYYELHGDQTAGRPLVLLHGGLGGIGMFGEVLTLLAKGRQVIAVELQAHGHTADIDRPLSFEAMADDIAALIKHLGLDGADILGIPWEAGSLCKPPSGTRMQWASWWLFQPPASGRDGIQRS